MNSEKELIDFLCNKSNICLYGAGIVGTRVLRRLRRFGINVLGFVVTEKSEGLDEVDGIKVYTLDELCRIFDRTELCVLVTVGWDKRISVMDFLLQSGIRNIILMNPKCQNEIRVNDIECEYNCSQDHYNIDLTAPGLEYGMGVIRENASGKEFCRVIGYKKTEQLPFIIKNCTYVNFKNQYGDLHILPKGSYEKLTKPVALEKKTEMYIATSHLDSMRFDEEIENACIPIQVGAVLTELRKGCLTDDTGVNISASNLDYCECTALYWIWKNTSGQRYVGLEHYRRRLQLDDCNLDWLSVHDVDVVLALPQFCMTRTKDYFAGSLITDYDWMLMKRFVLEYDASYQEILEKYDEAYFYFSCNLCLFKREWFDRYCEFAFYVTFKIENVYRENGVHRQDRYMGYIIENLLSIFMMKHYDEMNVVCTEVAWVE